MKKKLDAAEQLRNQQQFVYENTLESSKAQQQYLEAQHQLYRRREVIRVLRGKKQHNMASGRVLHTAQHMYSEAGLVRPSSGTT